MRYEINVLKVGYVDFKYDGYTRIVKEGSYEKVSNIVDTKTLYQLASDIIETLGYDNAVKLLFDDSIINKTKSTTQTKPVAYVYKLCPDCGAPIMCREVYVYPTVYMYEDEPIDGLPTYCLGTSTVSCLNCRQIH